MRYQIGCNYWASHAGTEMWARWDETIVEQDFARLSRDCGVRCLRVFPIWRDFQPICIHYCAKGQAREYAYPGFRPLPNEYGLDPEQMAHFATLCRLAEKYGLKLLVGLVTGWMSGMLFVPPALEGKNILCDAECLMWQNRFVKGFVEAFREEKSILAWDLGNECNNMAACDTQEQAYVWTMTISNAIRVADQSRPVVSGMHALVPDSVWNFKQQGELTDILTPHPYPSIFSKRDTEPLNQLSTTMYPTAQILYYSGLSGRQAMIEETGTFNDMLGNEDMAADYLRMSLWSGWANGAAGTLWWCAFDQEKLDYPPYDWNMCENELGLMRSNFALKPVANTMAQFTEMFERLGLEDLPPRTVDAVCVLTRQQNPLTVSLAATVLCKQAGFEAEFVYHDQPLPDAKLYLLPSLNGHDALRVSEYRTILEKVREGATLYISLDAGLILDFENVCGMRVMTRQNRRGVTRGTLETPVGQVRLDADDGMELWLEPTTAQVLGRDDQGRVMFAKNAYGKGEIYLLVAPLEKMLANRPGSFCDPGVPAYHGIYRAFAQQVRREHIAQSRVADVVVTQHMRSEKEAVLVAINYRSTDLPLALDVAEGWTLEKLYGGEDDMVAHNNGVILLARADGGR